MVKKVVGQDNLAHLRFKAIRLGPFPILVPAVEIILPRASLPAIQRNIRWKRRYLAGMAASATISKYFPAVFEQRLIPCEIGLASRRVRQMMGPGAL